MTKREKIRILKAMLPLIDTGFLMVNGLCRAYNLVTNSSVASLSDIGLTRPKDYYGSWWYPLGEEGDNQRRAAIRRAIKKLQAK